MPSFSIVMVSIVLVVKVSVMLTESRTNSVSMVWVDVCANDGSFLMAFFKCQPAEHPVDITNMIIAFVNKSHFTPLTIFNCVM